MMAGEEKVEVWGDFSFEEPQTVRFLTLPNHIMEDICRFLPTTRDKYEACFIHPQWTTAAQNVLWKNVEFKGPSSFRAFLNSIRDNRKVALLARQVYLALLDHEQNQVFTSVVKSKDSRHVNNVLSNPTLSLNLVKFCENITGITFYGWGFDNVHLRSMASTAKNLSSLSIIGANTSWNTVPIDLDISLLSRLTTLRLDGNFHLDDHWAEQLVKRATQLSTLQLSVQHMYSFETLKRICTKDRLPLTELVLTDASHINNSHIATVLQGFPHLTRFCLEGCIRVTAISILYAIKLCPQLTCLEIRGHPSSLESLDMEMANAALRDFDANIPLEEGLHALPCRLLVENSTITNDQLVAMAPCLSHVQTLGFKNCPLLTSSGIERAFLESTDSLKYLHVVHILNCPNIDSGILSSVFASSTGSMAKSLFRVHLEHSGLAYPKDIYDLCCASADYNLREITLVGYENIQESVIGTFNTHINKRRYDDEAEEEQESIVTLNRTSIDALAHSTDPTLCPVPADCLLNGTQIMLLAKHFGVSVNEFVDLIDKTQEEAEITHQQQEQQNYQKPHKKEISFDPDVEESSSKPANRLHAIKSQNSSLRPTTPALWSNDFQNNDIPTVVDYDATTAGTSHITTYGSESGSDETTSQEEEADDYDSREVTEEEVSDEYGNDKTSEEEQVTTEESEEEEYVTSSNLTEQPKQTSNIQWAASPIAANNASSEINYLGGWGNGVLGQWDTQPINHNGVTTSRQKLSLTRRRTSSPTFSSTQAQQANEWNGFREEQYANQWQQSELAVVKTRANEKKAQKSAQAFRTAPMLAETSGWGQVEKHDPWDSANQGFVKERINEQESTTYWEKNGDEWKPLNNTASPSSSSSRAVVSNGRNRAANDDDDNRTLTNDSPPPLLFADIVANGDLSANNRVNMNGNIYTSHHKKGNTRGSSNHVTRNVVQPQVTPPPPPQAVARPAAIHQRSASLVSEDGDVDWRENKDTQIRLSDSNGFATTATPTKATAAAGSNSRKQPEHPGRPKWSTAEDWNAAKDPISISANETIAAPSRQVSTVSAVHRSSWQDQFPPEVIAEKNSTNEWSSLVNNSTGERHFSRKRGQPSGSTTRRSSTNHRAADTRGEVDDMPTKWGDNSPATTPPPPSRVYSSSPPNNNNYNNKPPVYNNKQQQPQAQPTPVLLIDTENEASSPSTRPTLKDNVWDFLNSLNEPSKPAVKPAVNATQLLLPQEVSKSVAAPTPSPAPAAIPTETFNWSGDEDDFGGGNKAAAAATTSDSPNLFHFTETIVGTVTQEELELKSELRKGDNLVDFEDLVFSQPSALGNSGILTPGLSTPTTIASPSHHQQELASSQQQKDEKNELWGVDFTTTTTTTATATTHMTPTMVNGAAHLAAASPTPNQNYTTAASIAATAAANTPTTPEITTTTITTKKIKPIKLKVGTPKGDIPLAVYAEKLEDIRPLVEAFCKEHVVPKPEELHRSVCDLWTKRQTKLILGTKKPRKSTGTSSPAPLF